jgi:Ca-activated chloride channel family protein
MRRSAGCPYLNNVRARWDGDLAEASAAELQLHLPTCPVCREEQRALERLAMALRRGGADVSISRQQHERQKSALLERAQRSLTREADASQPRSRHGVMQRPWFVALGGLGVAVLVAAVLLPVSFRGREVAWGPMIGRPQAAQPATGVFDQLAATSATAGAPPSVQMAQDYGQTAAPVSGPTTRPREAPARPGSGVRDSLWGTSGGVRLWETERQKEAAAAFSPDGRLLSTKLPHAAQTGHAVANPAKAALNPNAYLSSTYIGGSGARDRVEKLIREGVVVQGRRVKLEAFPRNYAQAFPIPTRTALNLIAGTERTKIVQEGGRTFLQVGLQAMKGEAPRRPPLNLALVIDCSGSMADEQKLEYAKAAALQLVDRLRADDVISLVTFDDQAQLRFSAQRVRDRRRLKNVIASLTPGSGTNIYAGLSLGHQEARKHASPEAVSRVILLSDGEVTAGVSDVRQFQQLAAANVDRDIQTTAVGMGVQFNEDLMLAVAREGKGNYHFLRDGADAQRVFAKELEELTHVVAKAIRLRIRLADGVGLVRVLGAATLNDAQTRQVRAEEKKIDRKVADELGIATNRQRQPEEPGLKLLIPSFYRGDHHVVMLELDIPRGRGQRKVADVFLKYKDLVGRTNRETQTTVAIDYTARRDEMIASVDRNVKKNLLGFQTGEALAEAAALIARGRIAEAARKIDERMVVLGVAAREWRDRDLDRDGQLLDRYKTVIAQMQRQPQMANGALGQYLKKSLTYAGYSLTR